MRVICSNSWRGPNDKWQSFNGSHFILLTPAVTLLKKKRMKEKATQHVSGYMNTILKWSVWKPLFVTNVIKFKQGTFELKISLNALLKLWSDCNLLQKVYKRYLWPIPLQIPMDHISTTFTVPYTVQTCFQTVNASVNARKRNMFLCWFEFAPTYALVYMDIILHRQLHL